MFRPLMGWATAWSFDRLRLWIENGIDRALSLPRTLIHVVERSSLGFVWLYQGLIPKSWQNPSEFDRHASADPI